MGSGEGRWVRQAAVRLDVTVLAVQTGYSVSGTRMWQCRCECASRPHQEAFELLVLLTLQTSTMNLIVTPIVAAFGGHDDVDILACQP